eukprot:12936265-Prorocentrum_lima.AAC.1
MRSRKPAMQLSKRCKMGRAVRLWIERCKMLDAAQNRLREVHHGSRAKSVFLHQGRRPGSGGGAQQDVQRTRWREHRV